MSTPLHRRAFLRRLLPLATPVLARRLAGVPVRVAAQAEAPARVRVGPASALPAGQADTARIEGIAVLVVNDNGAFRAVSAVCTHEECEVEWSEAAAEVRCPCHDGRFDLDGRVTAGPPPAPLVRFATEVVDGDLWIVDREPDQ